MVIGFRFGETEITEFAERHQKHSGKSHHSSAGKLALADKAQKIWPVCRRTGISRSQVCEIKEG